MLRALQGSVIRYCGSRWVWRTALIVERVKRYGPDHWQLSLKNLSPFCYKTELPQLSHPTWYSDPSPHAMPGEMSPRTSKCLYLQRILSFVFGTDGIHVFVHFARDELVTPLRCQHVGTHAIRFEITSTVYATWRILVRNNTDWWE